MVNMIILYDLDEKGTIHDQYDDHGDHDNSHYNHMVTMKKELLLIIKINDRDNYDNNRYNWWCQYDDRDDYDDSQYDHMMTMKKEVMTINLTIMMIRSWW